MAPEVIKGEAYMDRADIWSVQCLYTLYASTTHLHVCVCVCVHFLALLLVTAVHDAQHCGSVMIRKMHELNYDLSSGKRGK